jgi:hypothetical protein
MSNDTLVEWRDDWNDISLKLPLGALKGVRNGGDEGAAGFRCGQIMCAF